MLGFRHVKNFHNNQGKYTKRLIVCEISPIRKNRCESI